MVGRRIRSFLKDLDDKIDESKQRFFWKKKLKIWLQIKMLLSAEAVRTWNFFATKKSLKKKKKSIPVQKYPSMFHTKRKSHHQMTMINWLNKEKQNWLVLQGGYRIGNQWWNVILPKMVIDITTIIIMMKTFSSASLARKKIDCFYRLLL